MKRAAGVIIVVLVMLGLLTISTAAVPVPQQSGRVSTDGTATAPEGAALPNPAAAYCQEQGYALELRTDPEKGQYGICILPDGTE